MFCQQCGAQNEDNAYKCVRCAIVLQRPNAAPFNPQGVTPPVSPYNQPPYPVNIPNYLPQAILSTLFCCLPFGIAAIVYASQVNSKITAGDIVGATEASNNAKKWCWVAFGLGLVGTVLYFGLLVLGAVSSSTGGTH